MGRARSLSRCVSAVLVLLLWATGCSNDDEGSPQSSPPPSSLPSALQGRWTGMHDEGPTTLTLRDCSLGEECGRLERIDDNGEHCVYKLEYRSEEADVFNFKAVTANSFGCGYSPWASRVMHLSRVTDDIVMVIAGGVATTSTTLKRAGS